MVNKPTMRMFSKVWKEHRMVNKRRTRMLDKAQKDHEKMNSWVES